MAEETWESFFDRAMQYYAAGRYAFFVWLIPVAGNLLHHAVEMGLKGALSKSGNSLAELRDLNHNLPKIWNAFKAQVSDASLDRFDEAISALHAYEELRYPDSVCKRGMLSGFDLKRSHQVTGSTWTRPEPVYRLCLEDVDELMSKIFGVASINPTVFADRMREEAKRYLREENVWRIY